MAEQDEKSLVPVVKGRIVHGEVRLLARGVRERAIALVSDSPAVRKAAMVSVAFAAGVQLSRMWRASRLRGASRNARDAYRGLTGTNPGAEGPLADSWVRYTVSVISTLSGGDGHSKRDRD
jgi:hypothetical protein